MLIYLLRHGQTEYNAQKRYQGQRDIPLSPEGAAQLRRADFDPDVVYVSTLQRTSQTARILFPEAKLVPVDGLKEMCFGSFEGRNFIEMEKDPEYQAWVKANCERWPPWSGLPSPTGTITHGADPTRAALCWMQRTGRKSICCIS